MKRLYTLEIEADDETQPTIKPFLQSVCAVLNGEAGCEVVLYSETYPKRAELVEHLFGDNIARGAAMRDTLSS